MLLWLSVFEHHHIDDGSVSTACHYPINVCTLAYPVDGMLYTVDYTSLYSIRCCRDSEARIISHYEYILKYMCLLTLHNHCTCHVTVSNHCKGAFGTAQLLFLALYTAESFYMRCDTAQSCTRKSNLYTRSDTFSNHLCVCMYEHIA